MYYSEMGSSAHNKIFELLEFDRYAQSAGMRTKAMKKDEPAAVRKTAPVLEEKTMDIRESIEDVITSWLIDVIGQERGEHDVNMLNDHFNNVLKERGILDNAITFARQKYSYYRDQKSNLEENSAA